MTIAVIVLSILCALLMGALGVAVFYLLRLGRATLVYVDRIEKCLDTLNASYAEISVILQTPVGSDDPIVRSVVSSIKKAHDSILVVAQTLSQAWNEDADNEENSDET